MGLLDHYMCVDVRCYKCNRLGAKNPPGVSGRVGGRRGRLSACDRLRGVGDQASRRGTRQGTAAILEQKAVRVCTSEDRGGLNFALALGRVAQPDRASAFEAWGAGSSPAAVASLQNDKAPPDVCGNRGGALCTVEGVGLARARCLKLSEAR